MTRQIIVADDHPLFREALKAAVGRLESGARFVEAGTVAALLEAIEGEPDADLLMLDLNMPGAQGFNALVHVRGSRPDLPVVVVSADDDPHTIAGALRYGAQGFIPKSTEAGQIGRAVEAVLSGEIYTPSGYHAPRTNAQSDDDLRIARRIADLTPQQFRVLGMLCSGLLNKQIAYELDVSEATVKAHVTAILRKLAVTTRTQAVLAAGRLAVDRASIKPPPEEPE
ncbi:MAG: DNA-binding response regulator [Lysobacterales bacterium]|jgi:DNA-binding NarL/FixJ family response regulator|nr:MAG: DNA-binding response regulator [Xanthomonadales bacterium]